MEGAQWQRRADRPDHAAAFAAIGLAGFAPAAGKPVTAPKWAAPASGPYTPCRQGSYKEAQGNGNGEKNQSIARYDCALCGLTMAATFFGTRSEYWPVDLTPKDFDPHRANTICRKAGAFSGFHLAMGKAAAALGMPYDGYGFAASLNEGDIDLVDANLKRGKPVAANVDYKKGSCDDHWILLTGAAGAIYSAIDPATGKRVK
ncbi:hypothetical protein AFCDBAGC_3514 [Methylobacterium cerastii]|uniref:Peptidase C39-like domain-containing protein n=1 Tax=Methylobacterium cerastii TaxID=932741 RepID=A0ABQ4QLE6_9HYPH|nr:hypothetical protein [Methylobacterium cerastii]GJD45640.1 hypothetical protein AFCDBAGC_3514 [Methylobacterium cerastii]